MKKLRFSKVWKAVILAAAIAAILVPAFWSDISPVVGSAWNAIMDHLGIKDDHWEQFIVLIIPVVLAIVCLREARRGYEEDMERMDKESDLMELLNEAAKINPRKK